MQQNNNNNNNNNRNNNNNGEKHNQQQYENKRVSYTHNVSISLSTVQFIVPSPLPLLIDT